MLRNYLQYSEGSNLVGVRQVDPEEVQTKLILTASIPICFRDMFDYFESLNRVRA